MPQTPETRIRAQYLALKAAYYADDNLAELWMRLARQWKRPIREIKLICGYRKPGTTYLCRCEWCESCPARITSGWMCQGCRRDNH